MVVERLMESDGYLLMQLKRGSYVHHIKVSPTGKSVTVVQPDKPAPSTETGTPAHVELMAYWRERYESHYGIAYNPSNWGREYSMIKSKLAAVYGVPYTKRIMDVVLRLYDSKWKTGKFLRPTIPQLCSWIASQAVAYVQANEGTLTPEQTPAQAVDGDALLAEYRERGWL